MGTFTFETGFGMLAVHLVVPLVGLMIGFIIIKSQARQKQKIDSRSDIEKQIDQMKEVRQR